MCVNTFLLYFPLLSCSPFLSFQSALRASGQSCAQCPWFLHNLHFVQLEKSCSLLYTQSTFLALPALLSCCFNLYNSPLHLSLVPLVQRLALLALVLPLAPLVQRLALRVLVRPAAVVLQENSRGRVEFQCTQLGHWVDVCLAVPTSPYFHVGNTNILWVSRFWWCRHIQIDFRTFHFSFLLTFCTCFFFFLLTFCTCFFPFLLTFCTCFFFPSC